MTNVYILRITYLIIVLSTKQFDTLLTLCSRVCVEELGDSLLLKFLSIDKLITFGVLIAQLKMTSTARAVWIITEKVPRLLKSYALTILVINLVYSLLRCRKYS